MIESMRINAFPLKPVDEKNRRLSLHPLLQSRKNYLNAGLLEICQPQTKSGAELSSLSKRVYFVGINHHD